MRSDKQRISELEEQIRRLVDLVEEIRVDGEHNKRLIRGILRGLRGPQDSEEQGIE